MVKNLISENHVNPHDLNNYQENGFINMFAHGLKSDVIGSLLLYKM